MYSYLRDTTLGNVYASLHCYVDAIKQYKVAADIIKDKWGWMIHYNLGMAYSKNRDRKEAIMHMEEADKMVENSLHLEKTVIIKTLESLNSNQSNADSTSCQK